MPKNPCSTNPAHMAGHSKEELTNLVKTHALSLGFDACGIAPATKLEPAELSLKTWLEKGHQGTMSYMENHFEKRVNPAALFPGAKSVVMVALNYFPRRFQNPSSGLYLSKYAYGVDYHGIVKKKLKALSRFLSSLAPEQRGQAFCDSAPVMERPLAVKAGLGWIGNNACLIIPKKGSFFFLGGLVTTMELAPDQPYSRNHCGNCRKCIDTCPTSAIVQPGQIDARRCISYLTIEMKGNIPEEFSGKMGGRFFGCDACQDVCPHNRFSKPTTEADFAPLEPVETWTTRQWQELSQPVFERHFKAAGSPMARIGFEKIKDNIRAALSRPSG